MFIKFSSSSNYALSSLCNLFYYFSFFYVFFYLKFTIFFHKIYWKSMFGLSYVFLFSYFSSRMFVHLYLNLILYVILLFCVCLCSFNFTQPLNKHKNHFTVNLLTVSCGKLFALNQTWLVLSLYNSFCTTYLLPCFFVFVFFVPFYFLGKTSKKIYSGMQR